MSKPGKEVSVVAARERRPNAGPGVLDELLLFLKIARDWGLKKAGPQTAEWWFGAGLLLVLWFAPALVYATYLLAAGAPPFDGSYFGLTVCHALFWPTALGAFCLWRARAWIAENRMPEERQP
jgi:hypothetical protein